MTVNRTTLLNLPLPVTGTESGTWGDTTNNGLTQYIDIAVAGMTSLTSSDFTAGALSLSNSTGDSSATNIAASSAQYGAIKVSSLATNSTITAPSSNRRYVIINADATYNLIIKASGQTGVTVVPGEKALVAFNGTDYVKVGGAAGGSTTQIQFNNAGVFGGSANLTWDGTNVQIGAAGALRLADTDSSNYVAFKSPGTVASNVTWTLPSADGTNGQALTTNGSGTLAFSSVTTPPGGSNTQVQYNNAGAFGGSANFVWDNSNVRLGIGTSSPAVPLDVVAQTSASIARFRGRSSDNIATLEWYDNTNATRYTYISSGPSSSSFWNQANTPMAFGTNDTERMRILSGGKVLINATTDRDKWDNSTIGSNLLQVERSASGGNSSISVTNNPGTFADAFSLLYLGRSRGTANNDYTAVASGDGLGVVSFQGADGTEFVEAASIRGYVDGTPGANDMPGRLMFFTTPDGSATPTERMRITSGGDVQIANGNLVISTSGKGIDFSATPGTGTSELLADYEEGTFTPTARGATTAGTTTYTYQYGYYTKIGRSVTVVILVQWSAMTGTGVLTVGGLPFASANNTQNYALGAVITSDLNWTGGTMMTALQELNTTDITLIYSSDDGPANSQQCVNESAQLRITVTYFA